MLPSYHDLKDENKDIYNKLKVLANEAVKQISEKI